MTLHGRSEPDDDRLRTTLNSPWGEREINGGFQGFGDVHDLRAHDNVSRTETLFD